MKKGHRTCSRRFVERPSAAHEMAQLACLCVRASEDASCVRLASTLRLGDGGSRRARSPGGLLRADDGVRTRDPQLGKSKLRRMVEPNASSQVGRHPLENARVRCSLARNWCAPVWKTIVDAANRDSCGTGSSGPRARLAAGGAGSQYLAETRRRSCRALP